MRPITFRSVLLAICACTLTLSAQSLENGFALSDGNPGTSDNPFGLAVDPDGIHAYVPLCGDLAPWPLPPAPWAPTWNNDQLLKVDLRSGTVVAQATVGHFPEDVALTLDPAGQTRHVYVTNSSSGTVTCLDASLNAIATIPLQPCFGGTYGSIFPFGIIASPDGSRVFVNGTSCNTFEVIDSDPASPTFNQVTSTFTVADSFGRAAWLSPTELVVPVTNYVFNPSLGYSDGSTTGFTVVDVTNPSAQTTWMLTTFQQFDYPQITGLACTPAGAVVCAIGYGLTPLVVEADPQTGLVLRSVDLGAHTGVGLHGLALSPDASSLAVTSFNGGELAILDMTSFTVSGVVATAGQSQVPEPNAVAFTPDGSRVVVTLQGIAQLAVYADLPGHDLGLWTDPVATIGTTGQLGVWGLQATRPGWVYVSNQGGPTSLGPWTIQLGSSFSLLTALLGDVTGTATTGVGIPNDPSLVGLVFHLQAVTIDASGAVRFSDGAQTAIN